MLTHDHPESAEPVIQLDGIAVTAQTHGIMGQTVRNIVYTNKKDQEQYPYHLQHDSVALACVGINVNIVAPDESGATILTLISTQSLLVTSCYCLALCLHVKIH
jgi:hypothetical protein